MVKTVIALSVCLVLTGCGKQYTQYAEAIKARDTAVAEATAKAQTAQYEAWSKAIVKAGETGNQGALVALAMSKPVVTVQPVQPIQAPASGPDYISALTPIAGVAAGAWAGGKIIDALANTAGIVNNMSAGGNIQQQVISQERNNGTTDAGTCLDCDKDEKTPPPVCPAGAVYGNGIWWVDRVGGCSCESRAAGHC